MHKLSRAVTKRTKACDKRLARLISYIRHTCECRQYCCVGNTAQQCRLGLFQDFDFARDLEDSKSTSRGIICISGSHTFVPISWMCEKQTSVSHGNFEAEAISLDAGLRVDGISSRPQLLAQPFSHTDLFLLSFGVCLQGRHPYFQPRGRVNELLVLLLCQTHSRHGYHHNSSSRTVERSICPLPLWNAFTLSQMKRSQNSTLTVRH